jgi:hypothetical protein
MKNLIDKKAIELETISGKKIIRDVRGGVEAFSTNVTPAQLINSGKGNFTVGMYRGTLAVLDLDALVNQPLVLAEQAYMLGLLGGLVEGYDLKTVAFAVGNVVGTSLRARITVPANQVWYISNVKVNSTFNASAKLASIDTSWRCSLWPDLAGPAATPPVAADADGGLGDVLNTGTINAEGTTVSLPSTDFGPGETYPLLRLPAGASITAVFTTRNATLEVASAYGGSLALTGYVGKALVK